MSNYLHILKKALKDPIIETLDCICPSNEYKLIKLLNELPADAYITEWKYGMGEIKYEYHVHRDGIVPYLKEAFRKGFVGGHPKLTALYSKKDIEKLIQEL